MSFIGINLRIILPDNKGIRHKSVLWEPLPNHLPAVGDLINLMVDGHYGAYEVIRRRFSSNFSVVDLLVKEGEDLHAEESPLTEEELEDDS